VTPLAISPWPNACTTAVPGQLLRGAVPVDRLLHLHFPPDPEVGQTKPAAGTGLTTGSPSPDRRPVLLPPAVATPRATAEPALYSWLASLLTPRRPASAHGNLYGPGQRYSPLATPSRLPTSACARSNLLQL